MHSVGASIIVAAPVTECYRTWSDYERLPEIMHRVRSVRPVPLETLTQGLIKNSPEANHADINAELHSEDARTLSLQLARQVAEQGGSVWHWEVFGPFNRIYSWNAGIVEQIPDKVISWVTAPGEELATSGSVNFIGQPDKQHTLIELRLTYSPPAVPFEEFFSDLVRYGETLAAECLEDFKRYMEGLPPSASNETPQVHKGEAALRKSVGVAEYVRGDVGSS